MDGALNPYIALLESFVDGRIDAAAFETAYLERFKNDSTDWPEEPYEVLDTLFADVDALCLDPALCGPEDLTPEDLRDRCRAALASLRQLRHGAEPAAG